MQHFGNINFINSENILIELNKENKQVTLSPGMQVTVEIKAGQRKVIEYLLTPLLRYQNESIRER